MELKKEAVFHEEEYQSCLRRLHYDDRDAVMYENMLNYLWCKILQPGAVDDIRELLEEYTHWNLQMIDKCFYHHPHDLPYAGIRRAWQTIIHLLDGDLEAGKWQLDQIGREIFARDGKAPRLHMGRGGKVYQPTSRLFLLYNYEKALGRTNPRLCEQFRGEYPFAFTMFRDGKHEEHDRFLRSQLEEYDDVIFYPEYERVYRLPGNVREFFLYFDEQKGIPLSSIPY